MPVKPLPSSPNLDHLKHQSKDLLREQAALNPAAAQRIREFHPRFHSSTDAEIFSARLTLSDAQLTIARERGFPSWTRLKRHIETPTLVDRLNLKHHERIEDPAFRRAVDLLDQGDESGLRAHLNPTLLEFVAENPIRHGTLPENIVQIARAVIEAGAEQAAFNETLMLVCSGRVPRECRVQLPLVDLLCDHGADPNSAVTAAIGHGEFDAVHALIGHGARVSLAVAAALGRIDEVRRLLADGSGVDRHRAFAWASQFGHVEIVRLLLDAGEDPDRYNPVGCHAHSTPLHQAALAGHDELVRLLVERGARLDLRDTVWQATPADWAKHAGRTALEAYLRAQETVRKPGATASAADER